tara:strand:+ start:955 stop:2304 length:1350 start_codon:yes stop_codon:yes gene_type:complete
MFKTPYKTIYRIQTIEEALEFDIKADHCDMYLYLIDVYDVLLNTAINHEPFDMDKLKQQRQKVHAYLMKHFHRLYLPIPGRLYGWSHNMLVYVVLLTMVEMQYSSEYPVIPDDVHQYCVNNAIRMYTDRDTETWQLHTYLDMLDVMSLRWRNLLPCEPLQKLLEIIWRVSAKMIIFMHPESILNLEDYVDPVIINDEPSDYVRMSVQGIIAGLSRYYWFHQTIDQWTRWEEVIADVQPITNWDQWIVVEKKHLVTRRFRDALSDFLWDIIINYGDHAIAAHDQLGDQVSNYACLYMRFPAQVPTGLSRICTYKEYEDMVASDTIRDMLFAKMIHQHFRSNYDVDFMKCFTVWEPKMWKHMRGIEQSPVPLILNMYYRFRVFYRGKIYRHPEGTTIKHAFIVWCTLIRKHCRGVCFNSMDFNPTIESMLDKKEVVNNTRDLGIFFDLQDD